MRAVDITVSFFSIQYYKCVLEIAYSISQRKFLIAFVDHNLGFTCSLDDDYMNGYINHKSAVEQLMHCRNHGLYDPIHFYEFLNSQLLLAKFSQVNVNQYIRILPKSVSNFEDRVFFNHWRSANISDKQRNKTLELMGYNVIRFCKENKLTPVFHVAPTERTLNAFQNFINDFRANGLAQ